MYRPARTAAWSAGLLVLLVAVTLTSAALGPVRIDLVTVAMAM
ncbi:transport system permease protein, partial [Natrinema versiforme JCM 10478]